MMNRWATWITIAVAFALVGVGYWLGRHGTASHRAGRRIFVSNYKSDTVSVIDDATEREIAVLRVGDSPDGIAVRHGRPLVAVANGTDAHVTMIDPVSLKVLGTAPVGLAPEDVAFDASGMLFVTSTSDRVVNVIDPDARRAVGEPIAFEKKPRRLKISPDGKRLYVLLSAKQGAVAVVDTSKRAVVNTIVIGGSVRGMGVTANGRFLFVERFDNDTVTMVDTLNMLPVKTFSVTTGYGIVVHPRKPLIYSMASFDDEVFVLDFDSGKVVAQWSYGQWPTYSAITDDGRYLYVVHEESDNIAKIDTETNKVVAKIAVGAQPGAAAIFEGR